MIEASMKLEFIEDDIGPIVWPPVPQVTPLPFEQCPAVYVKRVLDALRAVEPTEQTLFPALPRQIPAPPRIVQSQAKRLVQPASSSVLMPVAATSLTPSGVC